jgi:hypothetical protein
MNVKQTFFFNYRKLYNNLKKFKIARENIQIYEY